MSVIVTPGVKIRFEYDLDVLFNQVSLETLSQASKIEKNGEIAIDDYGISDDERDQFNQFISEGHIKVFQKLLKMTSGLADSIKIDLTGDASAKQKNYLSVTGTTGTATVTIAGVAKLMTFASTLATTILNFKTAWETDYLAAGVVITNNGNMLIQEAETAGVPFDAGILSAASDDLVGVNTAVTANLTMWDPKKVSCEVKDLQGYNTNYLPVIDGEIGLALKNFVIKEWFVKCVLGDLAKYYEQKYLDNVKAIIRYSLSLRKPSLT